MGRSVTIEEINLRDLSYIIANLRKEDKEELYGLFPVSLQNDLNTIAMLTADGCMNGIGYIAKLGDQPAGAFGVSIQFHQGIAWAFGTNNFKKVVPAITRYCLSKVSHQIVDYGIMRIEARPLTKHMFARNWLLKFGFKEDCELKFYGSAGQSYHLYSTNIGDYLLSNPKRLS